MNNVWGIGDASDLANMYMERNDFSVLTSLTVSPARHLRPELMNLLLLDTGTEKLRKLHLSNFDSRVQLDSFVMSGALSEVIDLRLSNAELTDDLATLIAKDSPRLKVFEASYNPKLTGVAVKALVLKEGEKLSKLGLDHCVGIGIDAVEFARSTGVEVKFSLGHNVKYGTRML